MKAFQTASLTFLLLLSQLGHPQDPTPAFIQNWEQATAELRANRALWESHNIRSYSFVSETQCFGCYSYSPAKLHVTGDSVVAALDPETGEAIPRATAPDFLGYRGDLDTAYATLDELFAVIEAAITNHWGTPHAGFKASNVSVEYDEIYGFPTWISVDYSRGLEADGSESRITDARSSHRVLEFQPSL